MRYELTVNRKELLQGLTLLHKTAKPKKNMEAVFTFRRGNLIVFANGVTIEATAEGTFPGRVSIPATQAVMLPKVLPFGEPLTVAHDESRLYIGTFSLACTWHDVRPNPIQLPIDPPFTVLLGLPLKYTHQQILQSGLSKPLEEAQQRQAQLIIKASKLLKELGVATTDVEELVAKSIRQMNGL